MVDASLLDFARTGAFAEIEVGHERSHVEAILGRPNDWGIAPEPIETAQIWKYGDIEFYFHDHELWMIFTDSFDVPTGGPSIALDPWIVRYGMSRQAFENALQASGIGFTTIANRHNEDETDLTTQTMVTFTFRERQNEYGPAGLCAFQSSSRIDEKPCGEREPPITRVLKS